MFFPLKFLQNHPVYRVHEIPESFLRMSIDATTFGSHLVPDWFQNGFEQSPKLRGKMQAVYDELSGHDRQYREAFYAAFLYDNEIQLLCDDVSLSPALKQPRFDSLHGCLHALMTHLYTSTLGTKSLVDALGGADMLDHYRQFIQRNGDSYVCPFCGLSHFRDPSDGRRESYDHWLFKKYYPAAAVNFRNLVPMCAECNESPNKGENDILYGDRQRRTRRRALFPYANCHGVDLVVSCVHPPSIVNLNGEWHVAVSARDESETGQTDTWKSVFNIQSRLAHHIALHQRVWFTEFLIERDLARATYDVTTVRSALSEHSDRLSLKLASHIQDGGFIKAAFFEFCTSNADDAVLMALGEIASSDVIRGRARMAEVAAG